MFKNLLLHYNTKLSGFVKACGKTKEFDLPITHQENGNGTVYEVQLKDIPDPTILTTGVSVDYTIVVTPIFNGLGEKSTTSGGASELTFAMGRMGQTDLKAPVSGRYHSIQVQVRPSQAPSCLDMETLKTQFTLRVIGEEAEYPDYIAQVNYVPITTKAADNKDMNNHVKWYKIENLLPGRRYELQCKRMNWFANSEHNYSHDQLSVVTRKDTPCPMKNTSYFSCDVSEDTNNSEVTFDLPHWTFLQHQCQGYMHQKQENISRNQEYEMKYETSQSITANKFDDRLNYCGTYPDRNISAVVSLQEALQSQFIKVKRTPMTNDVTGSWYLLDGEVDSKRRGFQENYSRQSPISIKDIRFGPSLISHNEYSLQSYFFGHPIDTGLQKAEMTHQQPQSFDCSTSPSTQGSIKQEKLDKSPKLQNNVVIQKQSLICRWKSCNLIFTDHKSFVNHIEASHVASHISNKEYCCYWEGCRRQLKPFNARYKLIVHLRIHNGDRPSKCLYPDCYKAFSRLENLKIHMRSHTGERPFICQQDGCNRAFSNSSDRAKHQRTHIHIKPYVCKCLDVPKDTLIQVH
ncbi:unnamed protein product [Heterobilharzia americana]|nr:unnamed protein product [Heterobilharzia americana]